MRFNGCDEFYDTFLKHFDRLGIPYDVACSVYDMNYYNLNLTKKEKNKLFYQNTSITKGLNEKDNAEVVQYVAQKDNNGNIVIKPLNMCFDDNICKFRGKKTVFEDREVKTLSTVNDEIFVENYFVDYGLRIQIYDKEALNYLKNYNIKYSDKDPVDKIYKETGIIPDIDINIDNAKSIIETADDYYEEKNNTNFYKTLKIEARKLIKTINDRKL